MSSNSPGISETRSGAVQSSGWCSGRRAFICTEPLLWFSACRALMKASALHTAAFRCVFGCLHLFSCKNVSRCIHSGGNAESKAMPVLPAPRTGTRTPFLQGLTFTNQQSASMTNNCSQLSLAENEAYLHMLNLNEVVLAGSPTHCYQTAAVCAKRQPMPTCTDTHTWKEPVKGESKGLRGNSAGWPPALRPHTAQCWS